MEEQINVSIDIEIPFELLQKLLQHLRDFDVANNDRCHFNFHIDCSKHSVEEMQSIFRRITPNLPYEKVIPIQDKGNA